MPRLDEGLRSVGPRTPRRVKVCMSGSTTAWKRSRPHLSARQNCTKTTLLTPGSLLHPSGGGWVSWLSLDARTIGLAILVEALARDQPGLGLTASALPRLAAIIPVILTTLIRIQKQVR